MIYTDTGHATRSCTCYPLTLKHPDVNYKNWEYTFSALLTSCAKNAPVTGEFPAQRPVTHRFDAFFDLRLNKRLSKQSWGWWFETPSRSLLRHCDGFKSFMYWTGDHHSYELSWTSNCLIRITVVKKTPGHLFTKNVLRTHYKPRIVWRQSQVHNGNLFTNKIMSCIE